jgi:hypothetical protein
LVGQTLIIDALKKTMSEEELKITLTCTPTRVAALSCLPQQVDTCRARRNDGTWRYQGHCPSDPEYLEKLVKMLEEGTVQDDGPHVDGVRSSCRSQAGHLPCVELLLKMMPILLSRTTKDELHFCSPSRETLVKSPVLWSGAGADPSTPYVDDGESHDLLFDAIMVENEEFAKL